MSVQCRSTLFLCWELIFVENYYFLGVTSCLWFRITFFSYLKCNDWIECYNIA